ncbi:MAG: glycosyl transferase [Ruminococcaceae bacterium]|nr:glycosyl transferase [Oscillospiraceae bacterium]
MIPKVIHYCWFGNGEKSDLELKCINSWKKYCPDYKIIEWNESNIDLSGNLFSKQAYDAKKWGFVPDYWRLWIIYNHGGIYLDTDVEIIKSFDSLLKLDAFAGFEDNSHVALGLGFGAKKGNPVIKDIMQPYETIKFILDDGSMNLTPSPLYNTLVLEDKYKLAPCNGSIQKLDGITIFPKEYFCPMNHDTGKIKKTKKTYSIHHFEGTWCDKTGSLRRNYYRNMLNNILHFPHRILLKIIGDKKYKLLKSKKQNEKR